MKDDPTADLTAKDEAVPRASSVGDSQIPYPVSVGYLPFFRSLRMAALKLFLTPSSPLFRRVNNGSSVESLNPSDETLQTPGE